jgi:hypothetical protein
VTALGSRLLNLARLGGDYPSFVNLPNSSERLRNVFGNDSQQLETIKTFYVILDHKAYRSIVNYATVKLADEDYSFDNFEL